MANKFLASLAFLVMLECSDVPRDVEEAYYNVDRLNHRLKPVSKRGYV